VTTTEIPKNAHGISTSSDFATSSSPEGARVEARAVGARARILKKNWTNDRRRPAIVRRREPNCKKNAHDLVAKVAKLENALWHLKYYRTVGRQVGMRHRRRPPWAILECKSAEGILTLGGAEVHAVRSLPRGDPCEPPPVILPGQKRMVACNWRMAGNVGQATGQSRHSQTGSVTIIGSGIVASVD